MKIKFESLEIALEFVKLRSIDGSVRFKMVSAVCSKVLYYKNRNLIEVKKSFILLNQQKDKC